MNPTLTVPRTWQCSTTGTGVLLRATAPSPAASGFTPHVLLLTSVTTGRPLTTDQQVFAENLAASVHEPDLEDLDIHDIDGRDVGYLRLAHRTDEHGELITEAWCWIADGVRWALLATVACADYLDFCDLLEDIAWSFTLPEATQSGGRARAS